MKPLEKIRTFIEIRLAEKTQKKVLDMIVSMNQRFASEEWKVRWVHPDNVHMTLRFLGDIDTPIVDIIKERLMPLGQMPSFRITVKGIGAFPSFGSPRIIWVGIDDNEGRLEALAGRMDEALDKLGFKPENRKFRPHITIGRVARRGGRPLVDLIGNLGEELFGENEIREFIFMKSELTTQRALHTPLWSIYFRQRRPERAGEGRDEGRDEGSAAARSEEKDEGKDEGKDERKAEVKGEDRAGGKPEEKAGARDEDKAEEKPRVTAEGPEAGKGP